MTLLSLACSLRRSASVGISSSSSSLCGGGDPRASSIGPAMGWGGRRRERVTRSTRDAKGEKEREGAVRTNGETAALFPSRRADERSQPRSPTCTCTLVSVPLHATRPSPHRSADFGSLSLSRPRSAQSLAPRLSFCSLRRTQNSHLSPLERSKSVHDSLRSCFLCAPDFACARPTPTPRLSPPAQTISSLGFAPRP